MCSVCDPQNTVRQDLFNLNETFLSVEAQFTSLLAKLEDLSEEEEEEEVTPGEVGTALEAISTSEGEEEAGRSASSRIEDTTSFTWGTKDNLSTAAAVTDNNNPPAGGCGSDQHDTNNSVSGSPDQPAPPEAVEAVIQVAEGADGSHYEECQVSTTLKVPAVVVEKSEIFITMKETSSSRPPREVSLLEKNLAAAEAYLTTTGDKEETDLTAVRRHLGLLDDVFVPANLTEEESSQVVSQVIAVKGRLREREQILQQRLDSLANLRHGNLLKLSTVL